MDTVSVAATLVLAVLMHKVLGRLGAPLMRAALFVLRAGTSTAIALLLVQAWTNGQQLADYVSSS